jgi:hypothetical protein
MKQKSLHRRVYETAGEMIRKGLWTVQYASFHYSAVTQRIKGDGK